MLRFPCNAAHSPGTVRHPVGTRCLRNYLGTALCLIGAAVMGEAWMLVIAVGLALLAAALASCA